MVDLQEKLLPVIDERERVLRNSAPAPAPRATCSSLPVRPHHPVPPGLGDIVARGAARPRRGASPLDKTAFGCFGSPEFRRAADARSAGRDQLVVAGHRVPHLRRPDRARRARPRPTPCTWPADAVGARTAENRAVGLGRMERAGARRLQRGDGDLRAARPQRRPPLSRPCFPICSG